MIPSSTNITPRQIFFDLEVDSVPGDQGQALQNITEFAAFDPCRPEGKQWFVANVKPQIKYSQKPVVKDYSLGAKSIKRVSFQTAWSDFQKWLGEGVKLIWSHNNVHDEGVVKIACSRIGESIPKECIFRDTVILANTLGVPGGHSLQQLRKTYNIEYIGAHEAWKDTKILHEVYEKMMGDVSRQKIIKAAIKPLSEHPYKQIRAIKMGEGPLATVVKTHLKAMPVFVQLVTTGSDPKSDRIAGIAAYIPSLDDEDKLFSSLINPHCRLSPESQRDFGVTDDMLTDKPNIDEVLKALDQWVKQCEETTHKVAVYAGEKLWDLNVPILQVESERAGLPKFEVEKGIDLSRLSNSLFKRAHRPPPPEFPANFWLPGGFHEVVSHCQRLGIPVGDPQRIQDQVVADARMFDKFIEGLDPKDVDATLLSKHSALDTATLIYERGNFNVREYFMNILSPRVLSALGPDNLPSTAAKVDEKVMWYWYDLETTGLSVVRDKVVEVAAIIPELGLELQRFANPGFPMPEGAEKVHHITDEMVKDAPPSQVVVQQFGEALHKRAIDNGRTIALGAGHNVKGYDNRMLEQAEIQKTLPTFSPNRGMDTLILSRILFDLDRYRNQLPKGFKLPKGFHKLQSHVARMKIPMENAHRALDDVKGNLAVFLGWTEGVDLKKLDEAMLMENTEEEVAKLIFAEGKFNPVEYLLRSEQPDDGFVAVVSPVSSTSSKRPLHNASLPPKKKTRNVPVSTEAPVSVAPLMPAVSTSNNPIPSSKKKRKNAPALIEGKGPIDPYIERTRITSAIQPEIVNRPEERSFMISVPSRSRTVPVVDGVDPIPNFVARAQMEVDSLRGKKRPFVNLVEYSSDEDTIEM